MRLVVDTNVLVSAAYTPDGRAGCLVRAAFRGRFHLFAPEHVRGEFRRVLGGKLGFSLEEIEAVLTMLPIEWVPDAALVPFLAAADAAIADPDDAPVIACAMALACPVVSGDGAFHSLAAPVVKALRLAELDL